MADRIQRPSPWLAAAIALAIDVASVVPMVIAVSKHKQDEIARRAMDRPPEDWPAISDILIVDVIGAVLALLTLAIASKLIPKPLKGPSPTDPPPHGQENPVKDLLQIVLGFLSFVPLALIFFFPLWVGALLGFGAGGFPLMFLTFVMNMTVWVTWGGAQWKNGAN